MEQIDEPKAAFAFLRPACVLLTREQTEANARRLGAQLRQVSDATLQQLQEYVLFPLRFVLKTPGPKREGAVQAAVEGVAYVLSVTCVRGWDVLRELFSELCLCLCSPGDPGEPAPCSEELKTAALAALLALLHSAYGDVVWRLYEPVMLPGLGAAVSLLLALAEREKAREVRAAALRCLQALLRECDCPADHADAGPDDRRAVGAAFASFLPGIALALSRVVAGDVRQGHEVTARAVRVWGATVALVMADDQLSEGAEPGAEAGLGPGPGRAGELVVRRTADWARETSAKLAVILKRILSWVSAHRHWRVRLEGVRLCDRLLTSCRESLGECVGPLLDALVTAATDEDPAVRDGCGAALEKVAHASSEGGGHPLAHVLAENLHALATSLPRLMRTSDDRRKAAVLGALLGYLKILGPGVEAVLNSGAHLQRVSRALVQVLELDVSEVRLVQERGIAEPMVGGSGAPDEVPVRKRKHFLYFTDEKVFSLLREVCRSLGRHGNLYLLVDHFLDLYRESSAYRKQAAIALNEIVTGAADRGAEAGGDDDDLRAAVTTVVEEYTSLENWRLATSVEEESDRGERERFGQSGMLSIASRPEGNLDRPSGKKGPTVHQLNGNVWQICIQLEGIGGMALALGSAFEPLLMTTLYPVLEKAGGRTLLISQSALATLRDVSRACGYRSARDLVVANSDYLLSDVALNLRRLGPEAYGPRVLAAMLAQADAELLPLVRDVLRDVLAALDQSYDERAGEFCLVLHSLLQALGECWC